MMSRMEAVHALVEMKNTIQRDIDFLKSLRPVSEMREQDIYILKKWNHEIEALNIAGESLTR